MFLKKQFGPINKYKWYKKELHNLLNKVFDKYASAVGEKHTTAARRDRLAFLMREVRTPILAKGNTSKRFRVFLQTLCNKIKQKMPIF